MRSVRSVLCISSGHLIRSPDGKESLSDDLTRFPDESRPPTGGCPMTRKWWTLAVVAIATFMLLLDITVVNTALPKMQKDLGASFTDLQWVIDVYALALATVVLTAGSLADRFGRKRSFFAGLILFSIASLACALAPSAGLLIAARAVQGIGGAIMFALSLALIAQEFPAG